MLLGVVELVEFIQSSRIGIFRREGSGLDPSLNLMVVRACVAGVRILRSQIDGCSSG